ncbi:hypothetical protein MNBD_DELTA01-1881 [hydrothermal vent metagenome]|uniref:TIGR04255 family protein n=1 Tax=hydrothermal vent metagenome TaxID=652676 RepID=A0A3B0R6S6_9ZZZZ
MKNKQFPNFKNPPVTETVLGVQFDPIEKLSAPLYGLYYSKIRNEYSNFEVHPPLFQTVERFDEQHGVAPPTINLEMRETLDERCWFLENEGNRLLQVQKDRFIQNWRKAKKDDEYPRYESLKPIFKKEWLRFCDFLNEEKLPAPEVNQCEVTYINHLEIGKGWQSFGEVDKITKFWSKGSGEFLPVAERVTINLRYQMPEKLGRLHITLKPVIRTIDMKELFQVELTARGAPSSSSVEDILKWLDLGREWVVKGFSDFTTNELHKIWEEGI